MLISVEWLNDHVDLGGIDPARVGELLTLHTAEVNTVEDPAGGWASIIVGHVTAVRPHPDADKLRLVTVEGGQGELEVVCGAPNVAEGQKICYAPEGTTLPGGLVLKVRKIRGVESRGMVLSERELGLGDDHDGILVLDPATPVGTPVRDVLPAGAIIDLDNTAITTRPDLWGHHGIAREMAAILERELRPLDLGAALPGDPPQVEVSLEAPDLCPRYLGWVIGGIKVEPSPDWLRRRLVQCGQRPINNIVDLTNYIQLELGQPLHAFDRRQIKDGRIVVRRALANEKCTTLDEVERELPEGACVIADPERSVAIAGVMGMANSEVMEDTTEIVLEVANFALTSIRSTSKALGLRTESAIRFQKGLDPHGVSTAARRFFQLLKGLCPTARPLGGPCDVRAKLPPPRTVDCPAGWVAARLGIDLADKTEDAILDRLGFAVERANGRLLVKVPSWRHDDVTIREDLVEEVGRIHGYDRIVPEPLRGVLEPVPTEPEREARDRLRQSLSAISGFTESYAYPFTTEEECLKARVEPGRLQVANAEQPGLDLMAPSLLPAALAATAENRKHHDEVALYVVAPVFVAGAEGELPCQDERCVITYACAQGPGEPVFVLKGALQDIARSFRLRGVRVTQEEQGVPAWLHPGRAARLGRGRETLGWFGQVHPGVARSFGLDADTGVADLDLVALRKAQGKIARMAPISRYPTVPFDVAVLVDRKTPADEVEGVLRRADKNLVRDVRLFDLYEGDKLPKGKRSLAFTITFGSHERTLDTADVERLRAAVSSALQKRGWGLRD